MLAAESAEQLQCLKTVFEKACERINLRVNVEKYKVVAVVREKLHLREKLKQTGKSWRS